MGLELNGGNRNGSTSVNRRGSSQAGRPEQIHNPRLAFEGKAKANKSRQPHDDPGKRIAASYRRWREILRQIERRCWLIVEPSANGVAAESSRKGSLPDLGLWSKIPSKFFGSGTAVKIGTSASLFYLSLGEHGNRNESNTFRASDRAIAADTGLSSRKICDARKAVLDAGLIACEREPGSSFTYTLLPVSLKWIPLDQRPRQKRKPRGLHSPRKP